MIGALEASGSDWALAERVYRQAVAAGIYHHWNGDDELDLHYCGALVARVATKYACMALAVQSDDGRSGGRLTIITGIGHHTPGGISRAVLPREIRAFLDETGLEYSEVEGNAGRVHLSREAIRAWGLLVDR